MSKFCVVRRSVLLSALAFVFHATLVAVDADKGAHEPSPTGAWIPPFRPTSSTAGTSCQHGVVRDGYRSIQVNVDPWGCNIPGDAANEPSIAVDPTDPRNIVIGWRQFNSTQSSFREAGYGLSHDAGHSWAFPGVLAPGQFRSDPVLDAGPDGAIFYLGYPLGSGAPCLFRSQDGGVTWQPNAGVPCGDKGWMTIDRTYGIGRGNVYITTHGLLRSVDAGSTFELWNDFFLDELGLGYPTISVDPSGTLYAVTQYGLFLASQNAKDPAQNVLVAWYTFLDLSAPPAYWDPNPGGLSGQTWVATDHSLGETRGNVYVLGSARSGWPDIAFIRSTDGGETWSPPNRVNDNPPPNNAFQWFGMMSVAPNGRIDVVWNDTRNSGRANLSELYYAFSTDAGDTWSSNAPVSPMFDSHIGWPEDQLKLGDYYHMASDNLGVNVAYAATFNGEQDIYFLRIGPWDCNGNEIDDALDISDARSLDCNANQVPDECEYRADVNGDGLTTLSDFAAFQRAFAGPNSPPNPQPAPPCSALLDPDHDADVDLHDLYLFQHVFTGE